MSRTLFDTNVLLDIATADTNWFGWSEGQFRTAAAPVYCFAIHETFPPLQGEG